MRELSHPCPSSKNIIYIFWRRAATARMVAVRKFSSDPIGFVPPKSTEIRAGFAMPRHFPRFCSWKTDTFLRVAIEQGRVWAHPMACQKTRNRSSAFPAFVREANAGRARPHSLWIADNFGRSKAIVRTLSPGPSARKNWRQEP